MDEIERMAALCMRDLDEEEIGDEDLNDEDLLVVLSHHSYPVLQLRCLVD